MSATHQRSIHVKTIALTAGALLAAGVVAILAIRLITGHGLGLWRLIDLGQAVLDGRSVAGYSHGELTNVIFLHHSTGRNLIEAGQVRERFAQAGYDFWDHDYNWIGLRRPDGSSTGYSYLVPDDNTDPDGLARIFSQRVHKLPVNTLSGLLQHEVIVFKSCFPVSNIASDDQLEQYKTYYLTIRDQMDRHRDRVFVIVTPPPLNPAETNAQNAARARAFATWLKSDEYLAGHPNVFTFDLFDQLAEGNPASPEYNMLRSAYRDGTDSHPNQLANETVGPLFVDSVIAAAQSYRAGR